MAMTMTSVGKDREKLKPSYIAYRIIKWCRCYGKQFCSSQKVIHTVTIRPASFVPQYIYARELKT